jgi:CrcB protein
MERLLWICLAGAIGTGVRYVVSTWAARAVGTGFPWGTLFVNLAGCFLIAAVMHVALHSAAMSATTRLSLTSGFLGGLTTYSSFNYETTKLFQDGVRTVALANFAVTIVGCFLAGLVGLVVARGLFGT